tara:strand:- start:219 stop:869 length:651 start_codon:yes stop_codon:yes gene_type:complete
MAKGSRRGLASIGAGALCFVALMYWYQWSATPLTQAEVDQFMAVIESQTDVPGGRHDMAALRHFLETDTGKPTYTVNLYKFHEIAQYEPGGRFVGGTGREAHERFTASMIPMLIRLASHPIFGSNWAAENKDNWDRLVIVRYRSRRDLARLFANPRFSAVASMHKWASLEAHERMQVEAVQIPDGRLIIVLLSLLVGAGTFGSITLARRFQKQRAA